MITLDVLRQALLSTNPFDEVDRLVRIELGAGRSTRQVFDELSPLTDAVLGTPGISDDGEEAYLGTMDALIGGCHPDCQYRDPPYEASPIQTSPTFDVEELRRK